MKKHAEVKSFANYAIIEFKKDHKLLSNTTESIQQRDLEQIKLFEQELKNHP